MTASLGTMFLMSKGRQHGVQAPEISEILEHRPDHRIGRRHEVNLDERVAKITRPIGGTTNSFYSILTLRVVVAE